MAIPVYNELLFPLLKLANDKKASTMDECTEQLIKEFKLTQEEQSEMLPSGGRTIFYNRIGWARTYLKKAGLIDYPKRGSLVITPAGTEFLKQHPKGFNLRDLVQFPGYIDFIKRDPTVHETEDVKDIQTNQTPEELLEYAFKNLNDLLVQEILTNLKKIDPGHFENIVIDFLLRMGYGGSWKDAGKAIGRSGDGGIDGIIKEDKLGLDAIYIQAKRWEGTVGRPEIQKFVGALHGQRAKKGIFITTSEFSQDALNYAKDIDPKIVLIDGRKMAELMIEHDVGVSKEREYKIKKIDIDYFGE